MKPSVTPSPVHPVTPASALCPLCDEELALDLPGLDLPDWRFALKWREAVAHRDILAAVAAEFRARQSIERTADVFAISPELTAWLLRFLCEEVCGCRRATCVSCLDDYRSVL